jgi:hypothetical protein
MSEPKPDLSPLLPDDAALKARRQALIDAVKREDAEQGHATSWRRRAPRLALGGVVAVAVVAIALLLSAGGGNTQPAFAVEPQAGGGVRIQVYSLEDAAGLEQALADAGIRAQVNWLPAEATCREMNIKPSIVKLPGGGSFGGFSEEGPGTLTISVGSTQRYRESFGEHRRGEISDQELADFNLDPQAFRPGQTVVITGSPRPFDGDPEGGSRTEVQVAEGPVRRCRPVAAPAGSIGSIGFSRSPASETGDEPPRKKEAVAAAAGTSVEALPAAGQFLYAKTIVTQLEGWMPNGPGTGSKAHPRYFSANIPGNYPSAAAALVSTLKEVWTAPDGKTRVREALDRVHFFSSIDQRHWKAAGSPPPFEYDPAEHQVRPDGTGRLVKEYASTSWRGRRVFSNVPKLSKLPTEPEALRLAVEHRSGPSPVSASPAGSQRGSATAERLWEILAEPISSPALRAGAINALAEIPGIGLKHGVTDQAGRRGDALIWVRDRGFGRELIFDPRTSRVLAQAEAILAEPSASEYGVEPGTVFRETAYLRSGIVDSVDERPGG